MTTQRRTKDEIMLDIARLEEEQLSARHQLRDALWSLREAVKQTTAIGIKVQRLRAEAARGLDDDDGAYRAEKDADGRSARKTKGKG